MEKRATILNEAFLKGIGIHSGKKVSVKLIPATVNSGIKFIRVDLPGKTEVDLSFLNVEKLKLESMQTNLVKDSARVSTIEHLLASLWAFGIDDIIIEIDSEEFPIMDGSSKEILEALKKAGKKEFDEPKKILEIKEPFIIDTPTATIQAFPSDTFKLSYLMSFNRNNVGSQYLSIDFGDLKNREAIFEKEISSARTFCFDDDVEKIQLKGMGKGGNYDNNLVIGKDGLPIKNSLRFNDEYVRHKVLDLLGDLYILGAPLKGNFIAVKSGHHTNMKLVEKIIAQSGLLKEGPRPLDLSKGTIDINEIRRVLPHRYPFLLVDKIIEIEKEKRVVGVKNVTMNEPFFQGHFPGNPIMPGVLMIEAMAQVGGLLLLSRTENIGKLAFFMAIDKAKFRKPVLPGDQLIMEVEILKARSRIAQVSAKGKVDGQVVVEAELMFGVSA